jgi:hypothetical protein
MRWLFADFTRFAVAKKTGVPKRGRHAIRQEEAGENQGRRVFSNLQSSNPAELLELFKSSYKAKPALSLVAVRPAKVSAAGMTPWPTRS